MKRRKLKFRIKMPLTTMPMRRKKPRNIPLRRLQKKRAKVMNLKSKVKVMKSITESLTILRASLMAPTPRERIILAVPVLMKSPESVLLSDSDLIRRWWFTRRNTRLGSQSTTVGRLESITARRRVTRSMAERCTRSIPDAPRRANMLTRREAIRMLIRVADPKTTQA